VEALDRITSLCLANARHVLGRKTVLVARPDYLAHKIDLALADRYGARSRVGRVDSGICAEGLKRLPFGHWLWGGVIRKRRSPSTDGTYGTHETYGSAAVAAERELILTVGQFDKFVEHLRVGDGFPADGFG
jgi:hypothetical protein